MKKNTFLAVIATVIVTGSLFWGCNKEQRNELSGDLKSKPVSSDMLYFDNFEQLFVEMTNIRKMSDEKRIDYEKSRKFTSFATVTEALYLPKIEKGETTEATIKELMGKYPDYFQLTTDKKGEQTFEPCLPSTPFRYIANQNRMFQVGDTVYKVFEYDIVSADKDKYKLLMAVTADNLNNLSSELTLISNNSSGSKTTYFDALYIEEEAINGNNKIRVTIDYYLKNQGYNVYKYKLAPEIRALYKVGIWWWCKRTISANLTIEAYIAYGHQRMSQSGGTSKPEYKFDLFFASGQYYYSVYTPLPRHGITSVVGYAETPNVRLNFFGEPTPQRRR